MIFFKTLIKQFFKRQTIVFISLFILCYNNLSAQKTPNYSQQEPLFSQYMFNSFLLNPSAAGAEGFTSVNFTGHEQWIGIPGAPKTQSVSVQTRVLKNSFIAKALNLRKKFSRRSKSGRVGLGLYIYNDITGPLISTGTKLTYGYHIPMRQSQLSFGLTGVCVLHTINQNGISFQDNSETFFADHTINKYSPDASFGTQFTTPFLYSGISFSNMFGYAGPRTYYIMGGYKVEINRFFMVEPSTLIKTSKGAFQMDISSRLYYKEDYWGGLSYRTGALGGAIIILGGIRVDKYYFGYAFDYTLNSIMKHTLGSHEFMVSIKFGENARRYRWLNRY
jgi:type IX secretion system PorP/SprF family membrane protein